MAAANRPWAADLLHFWFHKLRPAQWFAPDPALDAACARRFGRWLRALSRQSARSFLRDPAVARAAILLFDQIPRNIRRGSPAAFATDPLARAIVRRALSRGWDRGLPVSAQQFLLMPLMHSEAIADQRLSLARFAALGDPGVLRFARDHARMIARFGRFPHRNAVLRRRSSPAELSAVAAGNAW
jgi:uncharacterized protein (DUF924 family)